jgi:hypothetical protein
MAGRRFAPRAAERELRDMAGLLAKGVALTLPLGALTCVALVVQGARPETARTAGAHAVLPALRIPLAAPEAAPAATAEKAATSPPAPRAESAHPSPPTRATSALDAPLDALARACADPERRAFEASLQALRGALAEASPADLAALIAFFRGATDPTLLDAIAEALSPHGLARPEVLAALAAIADSDAANDRRAAAIKALGLAPADEASLARLDRLAREDGVTVVREAAANALGAVVERDPARGPAVARLLLAVALHDEDESVRAAALWSLRGQDVDEAGVAQLARVLARDPDLAPRQAAADALAFVAPERRAPALAALASALGTERDEDIRKTILASVVRAGGADSVPVLEAIKAAHADLAADAEDYLSELRRGVTDMELLHAAKERREDARRTQASGDGEAD